MVVDINNTTIPQLFIKTTHSVVEIDKRGISKKMKSYYRYIDIRKSLPKYLSQNYLLKDSIENGYSKYS